MLPLAGIDHVIVAVADLDRARLGWERLGFTLTPRGRHLQQPTGNYCIMFPTDYVELLGPVDRTPGTGEPVPFLDRGEGPRAVAFAPRAGVDVAAALTQCGLHPSAPRDLARQLELPERTVLPRFSLINLPAAETPGLDAFICRHLTPELVRRPAWLTHANAVTGIASVTIMVEATAPLREPYERLFGARVNTTDEVLTVHAGRHRLIFVSPDDFAALHPEAEPWIGAAVPAIAALTLRSADLARSADCLTQWHVDHDELADGSLMVPPEAANGTLLYFARG